MNAEEYYSKRLEEDATIGSIQLMEEFAKHKEESKWISVEDELPEGYQEIIYFDERDGSIEMGFFVVSQSKMPRYITHWQPLPTPPKTES